MSDIKPCICGNRPQLNEVFGKLSISCVNKKCKLKPSTWLYAGEMYDIREIIKYWNDGITDKRKK